MLLPQTPGEIMVKSQTSINPKASLADTESASTTVRNKCLLFIKPPVCGVFVIAKQTKMGSDT